MLLRTYSSRPEIRRRKKTANEENQCPNVYSVQGVRKSKTYKQPALYQATEYPKQRSTRSRLGMNSKTRNGQSQFVKTSTYLQKGKARSPEDVEEWKESHFTIEKKIGKGKFGTVYRARHKYFPKEKFALKVIRTNNLESVKKEISIQKQLNHKNVLKLFGYYYDRLRTKITLVLEYADLGELYAKLKRRKRFSERRTASYIQQLCLALRHCHNKGIIHRDIKPENLVLKTTSDGQESLKLCDFGWAAIQTMGSQRRKTLCGTLDYLPIEMVERKSHSYSLDLWCVGVLCYEFLVGEAPFYEKDQKMTVRRIRNLDLKLPSTLSKGAGHLITNLLQKGRDRLSVDEVLCHPWILSHCSSNATRSS